MFVGFMCPGFSVERVPLELTSDQTLNIHIYPDVSSEVLTLEGLHEDKKGEYIICSVV